MRRAPSIKQACLIGSFVFCGTCPGGGFEGLAPPVDYNVGERPVSVATGDIDNDGAADLAVANSDDGAVSILFGRGDGTFTPAVSVAATPDPTVVKLSDIDNNGKLDLVVLHRVFSEIDSESAITIHFDQDGLFAPPADEYRMGSLSESLELGDLNDDGLEDLVTPDGFGGVVSVRLGNPDGTFGGRQPYLGGLTPDAIALGDVTGDGALDVIVNSGQFAPRFYILPGMGDGTLGTPQNVTLPTTAQKLAISDLNGDDVPDVVAIATQSASVRLGLGGGAFAPAETLVFDDAGSFRDVLVTDLNGDSLPDLVVIDVLDVVIVRLGNGDGTFQSQESFACGDSPVSISSADFDGDASPDIVVANQTVDRVNVLINESSVVPAPFSLLAPANGAEGLPLPELVAGWAPARLIWEESTGFPAYRAEIATDAHFSSTVFDVAGVSVPSVQIPAGVLTPGTQYFWRVTASTPAGDTVSTPSPATFLTAQSADLNNDGVVNSTDLAALLALWTN